MTFDLFGTDAYWNVIGNTSWNVNVINRAYVSACHPLDVKLKLD